MLRSSCVSSRRRVPQTLHIDPELVLCDCPGLVMPSFLASKAEMVVWGVLPIDQMRDHVGPINQVEMAVESERCCGVFAMPFY